MYTEFWHILGFQDGKKLLLSLLLPTTVIAAAADQRAIKV